MAVASARVIEVVEDVLGRSFQPGERLDADSLSQVELILALEDALGIRLPDDVTLGTVDQVVAAVDVARRGPLPSDGDPRADGMGRFQWAATRVMGPLLSSAYRLRVVGAERVPAAGPAVLASNHASLLDVPALVVAVPRPVWFMAKVELFRGPLSSRFFHELGGFPVRRGGHDPAAVRTGLAVLERGRLLAMYPEGTRGRVLQGFLPGAAWMALATGAPLIPVGVAGTAEALPRGSFVPRRSRITVTIGDPLEPGREERPRARLERAREVTDDLRAEVEKLLASTTW
jgi:1-acyl-sn-glycerol-3-phosphate acyltransferase